MTEAIETARCMADWGRACICFCQINPLTPTGLSVRLPGCQKLQMMLYSCVHMATVGVKGLINISCSLSTLGCLDILFLGCHDLSTPQQTVLGWPDHRWSTRPESKLTITSQWLDLGTWWVLEGVLKKRCHEGTGLSVLPTTPRWRNEATMSTQTVRGGRRYVMD